jgi:hypothetical protein
MGGSGMLQPGPNPAADDATANAARGEVNRAAAPEGLSKTVQGVGDRVRRMAEAVVLAQKDMASVGPLYKPNPVEPPLA